MIARLIDILESLVMLMSEETQLLEGQPFGRSLPEIAATKVRLVGQLEQMTAAYQRNPDEWQPMLSGEPRDRLIALLAELEAISGANAAALERQIDLSVEMIGAITAEAKRLAGRATSTYGAQGHLSRFDPTMPIAINSSY
ncbi:MULTISPECIES: flagellar biosynthesis protein FlgN [Sphingomonas]|uniref:Flagellar biosynthesis protein FlgN n=1 Tax=Sphingomonas kyungheensis TaxID=1069987 RepID=A0ABU8H5T4_9SPHN|nr:MULTISPECIES: flagellar biosynthesis protein FlgN [unclassified Sphingomonas]EZP48706.1 FlgN protein [Sphingomonas sp. RIT328]